MAQFGMVGLGRMGANLVRRLMRDGHDCVVYDVNPDAIKQLAGEGATGAPRSRSWPRSSTRHGPSGSWSRRRDHREPVKDVAEVLEKGDAIIDGGNSYYRDDIRRARRSARRASTTSTAGPAAASSASTAASA